MAFCGCNGKPGNTGQPQGVKPFGITRGFIAVPLFDTDGNRNSILASDFVNGVLPDAFVQGKLNESDPLARWYPITGLENVSHEREASENQTFDSGATYRLRQGIKPFTGIIPDAESVYLSKLVDMGCTEIGIYNVDECGSIRGTISSDETELYPTPLQNNTWDPILLEKTDSSAPGVTMNFQYDKDALDSDLRMVSANATETDMTRVSGLVDVLSSVSGITTTEFTVDLNTCYGDFANPIKFKGRSVSDFSLDEVSPTPGNVPILTFTEVSDGVYTFTFAAETSGDVLALTLAPAVTGFELEETLVTIP